MKISRYALLCALSTTLLSTGCSKTEVVPPESSTKPALSSPKVEIATAMLGTATVNNEDKDTKVTYTFKNQSNETITVIGGAKYTLLMDHTVIENGAVAIKDYLDLEPGQSYTDSKTFINLPKGDYLIEVVWNKTKVTAAFNRS